MKIQLTVTLTVDRVNKGIQSLKDFQHEDGKAMRQYLKERAGEVFAGAWQYNAVVTKTKVTAIILK